MKLSCTSVSFERASQREELDRSRSIDLGRDRDHDGVDLNTASIPSGDATSLKKV